MKNKILFAEIFLFICTGFILVYTYFNKSASLQILYVYVITLSLLGLLLGVYYHLKEKKEGYINQSYITKIADDIDTPAILWTSDLSIIIPNEKLKSILDIENVDFDEYMLMCKVFNLPDFTIENIDKILKNEKEEITFKVSDGSNKYFIWSSSEIMENKNYKLLLSIGFDLTELKNMQDELNIYSQNLSVSESRYELSMELSEIGIILSEDGNDNFYASKELQKMLGLDSSIISFKQLKKKVHPNDKMLYEAYVNSLFKSVGPDDTKIHNIEFRILSADKKYRWYLYRYKTANISYIKNRVMGGAFIDIHKDKEKDLLIERLAYVDQVTDIPNRNKLMIMGQEIFDCCIDLDLSYWVIVVDIDKFHIINDTCGYHNGNKLLRSFAQMLYKYLSFGGFVARIGGDNFALIIKDYGDGDLPIKTVEKIQLDFSKLAVDVFSNQSLSCSAGYSCMPGNAASFVKVLEQAEFALSAGMRNRGTILGYDSSMHDMVINGNELEKALSDAIDNNELGLYYQPKVDLNTGKIIGVEALIRWIKPDGTIVLPGKFVPVAETSQLIIKISEYVLAEACRQNKSWQDMGLPKIVVSVNLTSADFYQRDIKDTVFDVLVKSGLDAEYLEIELTETLAMQDIDLAVSSMHQLRNMGIKLAMDDFGTGYSSLSYIQILPITLLKLDRTFIVNLETDEIAREIVSAVIKIAKSKKIETIAEGIEKEGQARILKEVGCDHAQGYLFGKPMPANEIAEFLAVNADNVDNWRSF